MDLRVDMLDMEMDDEINAKSQPHQAISGIAVKQLLLVTCPRMHMLRASTALDLIAPNSVHVMTCS